MDRIFLDANILFSAAYKADSRLIELWKLKDVSLISSYYAIEEARLNLTEQDQKKRLERLIEPLEIVAEAPFQNFPEVLELVEKDRPILQAAIHAKATHLLTGDIRHFGQFFGRTVAGVLIMLPASYTFPPRVCKKIKDCP